MLRSTRGPSAYDSQDRQGSEQGSDPCTSPLSRSDRSPGRSDVGWHVYSVRKQGWPDLPARACTAGLLTPDATAPFPKPFTSGLPAFIHNSRNVCLVRHDYLWRNQHPIAPYISLPRMVGPTGALRTLADAQICDNFTANVLKKKRKSCMHFSGTRRLFSRLCWKFVTAFCEAQTYRPKGRIGSLSRQPLAGVKEKLTVGVSRL